MQMRAEEELTENDPSGGGVDIKLTKIYNKKCVHAFSTRSTMEALTECVFSDWEEHSVSELLPSV